MDRGTLETAWLTVQLASRLVSGLEPGAHGSKAQNADAHFVPASAVNMHANMSQEPSYMEIYRLYQLMLVKVLGEAPEGSDADALSGFGGLRCR